MLWRYFLAKLKGIDKLRKRVEKIRRKLPYEVGPALYQEALIEQKESMRRTPVDTDALRASHETSQPKIFGITGGSVEVTISVGGASAPYALIVHEDPTAFHPVGQYKFLESTLRESAPHMLKRIGRRIHLNRVI